MYEGLQTSDPSTEHESYLCFCSPQHAENDLTPKVQISGHRVTEGWGALDSVVPQQGVQLLRLAARSALKGVWRDTLDGTDTTGR